MLRIRIAGVAMRVFLVGCILALGAAGCAAKSTVATRKQEKAGVYGALPAEQRALVDQGQIAVGMTEDSVYIAWGKPAQVLQQGDASGVRTLWLYHGQTTDEYVYWHYYPVPHPNGGTYLGRTLDRDINVREFVSAELVFHEGKLESWRMLPKPSGNTYFDGRP